MLAMVEADGGVGTVLKLVVNDVAKVDRAVVGRTMSLVTEDQHP